MSARASKRYRIKDLSEIAEVSRRAIRYYVQRGLLDPPLGAGRGSYYTVEHLEQLLAVKEAQEKGYSLEEIEAQNLAPPQLSHSVLSPPELVKHTDSLTKGSLPSPLSPPSLTFPLLSSLPPDTASKLSPLDETQSLSTWLRIKVADDLEIHLKEGALSSSELENFRSYILEFFLSKNTK